MNWTEKYRPKRIADIRGQNKFVADATSWIEKNNMPNVLIYGNPGNGKTTAGHCLANEFLGDGKQNNFIEINASQDRKLDTIRTTITNFANTKGSDDVPFKICLLDEIDGMTRDSQRALKRTMERATNVRFIITCNEHSDVDYAIEVDVLIIGLNLYLIVICTKCCGIYQPKRASRSMMMICSHSLHQLMVICEEVLMNYKHVLLVAVTYPLLQESSKMITIIS